MRLKLATAVVLLFVLKGIVSGLQQGPAPPSQFYVTYHTPFINSLLGNFEFTQYLGEYIGNNVGLWLVLFLLGCVFPYAIYDIITYNFCAITRMMLYLKPSVVISVLMMHGVYELGSIILVSTASMSFFLVILQEIYSFIRRRPVNVEYRREVELLSVSLLALVGAAFIEGYIFPLFWR